MSYYYDDFYNEPTEFDEKMEELKESLAGAVKSEFLEEMERLKKEKAEAVENVASSINNIITIALAVLITMNIVFSIASIRFYYRLINEKAK